MKVFATFAVLTMFSLRATCDPSYDKTAHVFISQTTSQGYHVGDHVCYSTDHAVDCFPDEPRSEYRFELENGGFATVRFIAAEGGLDALALLFESKGKDTTIHYRLMDKASDLSKAYTIGVPYSDEDEHGHAVQKESRYRLYPDARPK